MIQALQQREDADIEQVAAIEYHYLPLLHYQTEPIALQRLISKSPKFFVSVISAVFLPAARDEVPTISEDDKLRARLAYQILQSIKTVPGFDSDSEDILFLRRWIEEVRKLAQEADRTDITDQQIGQILAYAPADPLDNAWPTTSIRDVIEDLALKHVETGISVARFNMRGAFAKDPFEGGKEERSIAAQYRTWASQTRKWPRTTRLLEQIADGWISSAKQADTQVQLDQLQ